jgi:hypothetical protein
MWATGAATKNFASDEKSTDKHEASCKSEIQNEFFNRIDPKAEVEGHKLDAMKQTFDFTGLP